jgi:very-short-patch-repair endonuclease
MSYIATQVLSILKGLFPDNPFRQVFCEHYVNYKGQRLFFDFYIKKLNLFIEVQGRQHVEYTSHFHNDRSDFLKQRERDNLKREWIEENNYYLARLYYNEDITEDLVLHKIEMAMKGGFYE